MQPQRPRVQRLTEAGGQEGASALLSRELVALWADSCPPAMELLRRVFPTGLMRYLAQTPPQPSKVCCKGHQSPKGFAAEMQSIQSWLCPVQNVFSIIQTETVEQLDNQLEEALSEKECLWGLAGDRMAARLAEAVLWHVLCLGRPGVSTALTAAPLCLGYVCVCVGGGGRGAGQCHVLHASGDGSRTEWPEAV